MRRAALITTLVALLISLTELAFALLDHPFLFGTPWFFVMHLVAIASIIAAAMCSPASAFQGGTLLFNRLKPYLPPLAYRFLAACFIFTIGLVLVCVLADTSHFSPAVYFSAFWVSVLASSATVIRYVQASHVAGA
jgi:hypothetical protein